MPGVVALSGSAPTDPDTNPPQPLAYTWEQIDPTTGDPVAVGSPARGMFSNPTALNTDVDRGHDGAALGAVPPDGHRRDRRSRVSTTSPTVSVTTHGRMPTPAATAS